MHDAVSAESHTLNEPWGSRDGVDDGMVVGRLRIETGPAFPMADRDILEKRETVADARGNGIKEGRVERRVHAGRIGRVGEADENAGTLAADEHTGVIVDAHGDRGGNPGNGLGAREIPPARND